MNHGIQTKSIYDDNAETFLEQPLNDFLPEKIKLSEKVINGCKNLVNLTGLENFDCDHKTTVDADNLQAVVYVGSATSPDNEHVSEKKVDTLKLIKFEHNLSLVFLAAKERWNSGTK